MDVYLGHSETSLKLVIEIHVGDQVQMRKQHPCGGDTWEVYRVGADIGLRCLTCQRRVMLARSEFSKRLKRILEQPSNRTEGDR